jgi:hypothetical protein
MKRRDSPIRIPFKSSGDFVDVLMEFTDLIEEITGEGIEIEIDMKGTLTIKTSLNESDNGEDLCIR